MTRLLTLTLTLALLALVPAPAQAAVPVEGTRWQLARVVWRDSDGDRRLMKVAPDVKAWVLLEVEGVDFHTGCNPGHGTAYVEEEVIEFHGLTTTLVGCTGKRARVERKFLKVLREGDTAWSMTDDVLRLERSGVRLVLTAR